jgi:tetratricopeptide (TPR) repeat protein
MWLFNSYFDKILYIFPERWRNMNLAEKFKNFKVDKLKDVIFNKISNRCIPVYKKYKKIINPAIAVALGLTVSLIVISNVEKKPVITANVITDNVAEEAFYAGQYDKAIDEYLKIFNSDSKSPIWYLKVSEIYSVMGDMESSRKYIQLAKDLRKKLIAENEEVLDKNFKTKDIEVLNYIVFTEFMNKDYKTAMEDGEEALSKYKDSKKIIKTMLPVYMVNQEVDKAKVLIALYDVDEKSAYDVAEHARMKMLMDQWEEGFDELKLAWYIDRDEYKIFDILAQISAYNKDKLLEKIMKLSEKDPLEPAYKVWLAKIYSMREETSELAQKILDEVKSSDMGSIENVLIRAAILQNTKQTDKADELVNRLIQENKDDYRVLHTAGWFYLQKNELDKAMEYCKQSIVKNKNYPDNYGFLMPEILKAMGKDVEGEPYFRTALLKEPYNYNIMITIANYYWYTTKNSEKALEYFKSAEIVKSNDAEIKYNMALIHLTNNREDDAVELLKQSIKLEPAVPKYHRTLGTIYMIKGKFDDGIKEIRNAYESDKEDILTLNNAGCYYITVTVDLERGVYNFQKAYEGINDSIDDYSKQTITENYDKAKKLLENYKNGKGGESLQIPELVLFY